MHTLCLCLLLPVATDEPKDELKLSKVEKQILELTNAARKEKDLPPLKPQKTLLKVARTHSANMAKQQKMAHVLDDTKPHERVKKAGYKFRSTGENIAAGDPRWPVEKMFRAWMDSKPHRENILSPKYTEIGIGIGKSVKGEMFYTQVFGSRQRK